MRRHFRMLLVLAALRASPRKYRAAKHPYARHVRVTAASNRPGPDQQSRARPVRRKRDEAVHRSPDRIPFSGEFAPETAACAFFRSREISREKDAVLPVRPGAVVRSQAGKFFPSRDKARTIGVPWTVLLPK